MAYLEGRLWPTWYRPEKRIPACDLIDRVCRRFGVSRDELMVGGRGKHFVAPRAVIIRVLRDRKLSYPMIGRLLKRDHTTMIYHNQRFENYARIFPGVSEAYLEFRDV